MKAPYSDNYMTYDTSEHRYILTDAFVREKMNIELSDLFDTSAATADIANEKARFLDRVSLMIYGFIYRLCPLRYVKERELALDASCRIPLRQAMAEQIRYIMFNGDLSLYSGVNAVSGTQLEAKRLREGEIAPMAKDVLAAAKILQIAVPPNVREIEPRYEEEWY